MPQLTPRGTRLLAALDVALIAVGLLLLTLTPRQLFGDGRIRYLAVRSLLDGDLPREKYSLVEPVLALPVAGVGRLLGAEEAFALRFNVLVLALGLVGLWLLLRRTDSPVVRPLLLLVVYGSMAAAHVNSFLGETVTAVGLLVGLVAVSTSPHRAVRGLGWVLVVLAAVNTPAAIPAAFLAVAVLVVRTRRYHYVAVVPVVVALALLDARLHTGSFTSPYAADKGFVTVLPYSGRPNFSYPFVLGLLAILVSFGKGLVFFTTGAFLSVRGRLATLPRVAAVYPMCVAVSVGLVLVYSRWWAWYGGFTWGPRFFLLVSLVACLVLAVRLVTPVRSLGGALLTLGVLALSCWVAVSACLGQVGQDACRANRFALEHLCWYAPEFSVLWTPLRDWPATTGAQKAYIGLVVVTFFRLAVPFALSAWRTLDVRLPRQLSTHNAPSLAPETLIAPTQ